MSKCGLCKERDSIVGVMIDGKDIYYKASLCEDCLLSVMSQFFQKEGNKK